GFGSSARFRGLPSPLNTHVAATLLTELSHSRRLFLYLLYNFIFSCLYSSKSCCFSLSVVFNKVRAADSFTSGWLRSCGTNFIEDTLLRRSCIVTLRHASL
uniref:Uncharacterized protein n=1 Tax=Salarias fasciatus TaxID=181472 RepID=A0A672G8P5_SALFA